MGGFLRQSTAAVIPFGVFVDKTDGVTLEVAAGIITSLDHATTGIFLSKNGGAGAIRHQAVTASTLDAYGMFLVTLDTTDTNTLGRLRVMMAEAATFLPVWDDYMVIPASLWDTLFVAQPTAAILKFFNKASPTGTVNSLPDAVPNAAGGLPVSTAGGLDLDAKLANTNEITAARMGALTDWINGGRLDLILDIIAADTTTDIPGLLATIAGYLDTEIATLVTEVGKVPKSDGASSWNATALAALGDASLDEVVEGTLTLRQIQRILLSFISGIATGGGTTTITFKDLANTKARITMTVDTDGNRSAVTLDGA